MPGSAGEAKPLSTFATYYTNSTNELRNENDLEFYNGNQTDCYFLKINFKACIVRMFFRNPA